MKKILKSIKGAALVEYGLLVGLIAVFAIIAVTTLGSTVRDTFANVSDTLSDRIGLAEAGALASGGEGAQTPSGPTTSAECYNPANANTIGDPSWEGCANMLIVDNTAFRAAAASSAGGNQSFSIFHAPSSQSYSYAASGQQVFTGQVTNMSNLFMGTNFTGDISHWDTSSVTNMQYMFRDAVGFNGDIDGWDTSSVVNMNGVFYSADAFNQPLNSWDTSSVEDMNSMFIQASVFNGDISDWDTSNVEDMGLMFQQVPFNQDITGWDTSSVTNMTQMFYQNNSFGQDLSGWCVTNIGSAPGFFATGVYGSTTGLHPVWGTCP